MDELLRLVSSIQSGRVSAVVALQRFGSAAQGDPVFRAADQLGKLLRTFFCVITSATQRSVENCIHCSIAVSRSISFSKRSTRVV